MEVRSLAGVSAAGSLVFGSELFSEDSESESQDERRPAMAKKEQNAVARRMGEVDFFIFGSEDHRSDVRSVKCLLVPEAE